MKHRLQALVRTLRGLIGLHLEYEDLVAYRDGESGLIGQWCVAAHLRRCQVCQTEAARLEQDLRNFTRTDNALYPSTFLNLPKGLDKLRQAIADWETQNILAGDECEPVQTLGEAGLRQLARDFSLYLGERAGADLLFKMRAGQRKHRDVFVEAQSVLGDFLGPGAASAVTQRILYAQMAKDRTTQNSPAS